jgi:hypothetical protein
VNTWLSTVELPNRLPSYTANSLYKIICADAVASKNAPQKRSSYAVSWIYSVTNSVEDHP